MIVLDEKVTISRRERVSDGQGGWTERWIATAAERVRIRPRSARSVNEVKLGAQLAERVTHVMYALRSSTIARGDQIITRDGTRFNVMAVRMPSAGRHLEIDLREAQTGQ